MNPRNKKILFAEDEPSIAQPTIYNLERAGYAVTHHADGASALKAALSNAFDLAILDVMLPSLDGFSVLEQMRAAGVTVPVLMLTALSDTKSRVQGIRGGADDYLGKPFDLEEFLARVAALLRRQTWIQAKKTAALPAIARVGSLLFDRGAHTLVSEKAPRAAAALTAVESKLLSALLAQALSEDPQRVIPRAELLAKVWGLKEATQTRTLDMFVARLRQTFLHLGEEKARIEAMRGVGYRLVLHQTDAFS